MLFYGVRIVPKRLFDICCYFTFFVIRYSLILYFLLFVIHHFVLFVIRYSLLYNFRYSLFVFFVLFVIRFLYFSLFVIRYFVFFVTERVFYSKTRKGSLPNKKNLRRTNSANNDALRGISPVKASYI